MHMLGLQWWLERARRRNLIVVTPRSGYFQLCLSKLAGNLKSDVFSAKPSKSTTWFPFSLIRDNVNGPWPCHVSGIPLQKGTNPFCKGEKRRCLAGEERRLPFEEKKIPAHMTRANVIVCLWPRR
jgi:hypothetical protein